MAYLMIHFTNYSFKQCKKVTELLFKQRHYVILKNSIEI